jgi:hypothetical protein
MRCLLELDGVALVTVTAPGQDFGLVWDRSACTHLPDEPCSGPKGCRVVAGAADGWNAQAESSWGALHRAAAQIARRRHGSGPIVAAKVWEVQERGLLHLHLVVPFATPRERARAREYVAALDRLRQGHGFGFVQLRERFDGENGGARAAGYCAKYIGKAAGTEMAVRRPAFVGSFLTRAVGLTIRLLRWRRYIWQRWGFRPGADELRPLVQLLQAFPSLEYVGTAVQPGGP